jgi:hypothetical protein|tara:strand:- start:4 stop:174 length:171 start_codon:yes stop_codon:yes gene_type:complete
LLCNIVDEFSIGQILKIATKLKGDMITKELLEQLVGLGNIEKEIKKQTKEADDSFS